MWRSVLLGSVFSTSFLLATPALADVISMEEDACGSSEEGDACEIDGKKGSCVMSTCSRNDYSQGTPPTTVSKPCLLCEPGKAPEALGDKQPSDQADSAAEKGADSQGDETPKKVPPTAEQAPSEKRGGCSAGAVTTGSATMGLALFGLLLATRRRRSQG